MLAERRTCKDIQRDIARRNVQRKENRERHKGQVVARREFRELQPAGGEHQRASDRCRGGM